MGLDIYAGKLKHQYSYDYTIFDGKDRRWSGQMSGRLVEKTHTIAGVYDETLYEKKRIKNKWYDRGNDEWYPIEFGKTNRIRLKPQDIDLLEKAVNNGYAEYFCDGGFFWGHQMQEEQAKYYRESRT